MREEWSGLQGRQSSGSSTILERKAFDTPLGGASMGSAAEQASMVRTCLSMGSIVKFPGDGSPKLNFRFCFANEEPERRFFVFLFSEKAFIVHCALPASHFALSLVTGKVLLGTQWLTARWTVWKKVAKAVKTMKMTMEEAAVTMTMAMARGAGVPLRYSFQMENENRQVRRVGLVGPHGRAGHPLSSHVGGEIGERGDAARARNLF